MPQEKSVAIIAGTLAGVSVVTVGQPFDYIQTLYQIRTSNLPSMREMYRQIGFSEFYRGASSIYMFVGAIAALQFQTFQTASKKLYDMGLRTGLQPSTVCLMLAGFTTGLVCSFIYTPIEYAKVHSQISNKPSMGSAARIFHLLAKQKLVGLRKLYTGHIITVLKESSGSALYYGGYYVMLTKLFKQKRDNAATWAQILSGGLTGIMYQLYSYPIDTIKTNLQTGHKTFDEMIKSKFWNTSNFRNGLKVSLLRSFIVDATNFTVYENVSHFLINKFSGITLSKNRQQ